MTGSSLPSCPTRCGHHRVSQARDAGVHPTRRALPLVVLSDLADRPERNVGLDELAAAGIGKFRLIRLFGEPTSPTPHALQVAHRIRKARRLLEAGETIADVAAATGFVDGG
jgi:transcriptional regulator GlxA family with amidase domain